MKTRQKISLHGLEMSYYRYGQGPPLLFLHGGRLRAQSFRRSLDDLSKRYTIIAPDIPGYGATMTPQQLWSYVEYAKFFDDFLDILELRNVTIVGYSMGGGIAFNLAATSQRIGKLVLVDASGLYGNTKLKPDSRRRLLFYLKHPRYYKTLALLIGEYARFEWKHRSDRAHMERIRLCCRTTQYSGILQNISVPTQVLWGEADLNVPLEDAYQFQKQIPQATLKTVQANHDWPLYMPLLLSESIL